MIYNAFSAEVIIDTIPSKANLFIVNPKTLNKTSIGKSPFKMTFEDFTSAYAKGDSFIIEVSKEGHQRESIMILNNGRNNIEVKVSLEAIRDHEKTREFDSLISSLFDVQRLVRNRNYKDALNILNSLEKEHPEVSSVYEIKAGALYLSKEFSRSLAYYRKAFDLNPKNSEAYRMKQYLEKKFKLESPKK
jgi:tetratricopeptide (TPR) repeat protein